MRIIFLFMVLLALGACTTVKPAPDSFDGAEQALEAAIEAGAEEYAPVELRFAREKLAQARANMENKSYDKVIYQVEQSQINSELALEKSLTAALRARVTEAQRENEILREDYQNTFGEDF